MKKTLLTAVAMLFLASPVLTAASASAQSRHEQQRELRQDRKELRQDKRELRQDRKELRQDRRAVQRLKRGGRYRNGGRNVSNYRQYGLRAPGRGQRWVRYNNDYLLVTIANGLIASVIVAR
ncbi:RcnB family protein [Aureimonas glaciei]|jgi:Ni/Co efflux regulator RcnB|uniref:Integral membrane protein n=1 Tax=Aureimonas glaciei TaxID=1776957 RepID=A0A916XZ40_9HYPH|nr:RcnB family protein [Aureimonas glaciei]GGD22374.1 hypothetical protein GCM10011335_26580 [Aureimonas glaciei]